MRSLVLSDIHGNLEALEVCLADAGRRGYDRVLVLGDLVGYGADPNAVVDRIRGLQPQAIVRGNHDKVACGLEAADGFNPVARSAAEWTAAVLAPEHREWLARLPQGPLQVDDLIEICHGSPSDEDAYVFDELDAARALAAASRPLCLFGHTHFAAAFTLKNGAVDALELGGGAEHHVPVARDTRSLINPGSVGQPRDGDPRAGYAIVDDDAGRVQFLRLAYPIAAAQSKIIRAGLPELLAYRLALGR